MEGRDSKKIMIEYWVAMVESLRITVVLEVILMYVVPAAIAKQPLFWTVLLCAYLMTHILLSELDWIWTIKFTCRNCGGGDRGRVAIYHPFGEFRRDKIELSPVWCSRPTTGVLLAHATMNFMGLDLTTSDRWH
ncbi:hypothetical protein TNCV_96221 [Trichonephila clavipes]|nr:hypothetical protein TNCV_96221 [Trichonephila clavipes]